MVEAGGISSCNTKQSPSLGEISKARERMIGSGRRTSVCIEGAAFDNVRSLKRGTVPSDRKKY